MFENLKHAVKRVLNFSKQNTEPCIENICICDDINDRNEYEELNPRISSKHITFQYRNFVLNGTKNETQSDTTAIKMRKQRIREESDISKNNYLRKSI
jgi:hypothetical protein